MKLSQSLKLGITLLGIMLAAGLGSGFLAYKIGYESLKSVSQPDINPTKKFTDNKAVSDRFQEFTPVKEQDIIKKAEADIREPKTLKSPAQEVESVN